MSGEIYKVVVNDSDHYLVAYTESIQDAITAMKLYVEHVWNKTAELYKVSADTYNVQNIYHMYDGNITNLSFKIYHFSIGYINLVDYQVESLRNFYKVHEQKGSVTNGPKINPVKPTYTEEPHINTYNG